MAMHHCDPCASGQRPKKTSASGRWPVRLLSQCVRFQPLLAPRRPTFSSSTQLWHGESEVDSGSLVTRRQRIHCLILGLTVMAVGLTAYHLRRSFIRSFFERGPGQQQAPVLPGPPAEDVSPNASLQPAARLRVILVDGLGLAIADALPHHRRLCESGIVPDPRHRISHSLTTHSIRAVDRPHAATIGDRVHRQAP